MAYKDFTFPKVLTDLGLAYREERLFADVPPIDPGAALLAQVARGGRVGRGTNTEKALSEFLIAPILSHLLELTGDGFSVFSGLSFDVDRDRGLNGFCDFLLSRDRRQMVLYAPVVVVAEAKPDLPVTGFAQCIAGMVAAREFNRRAGGPTGPVYGSSTSGTVWQFLRLDGDELTIDPHEYPVADSGCILGILRFCITGEGGPTP